MIIYRDKQTDLYQDLVNEFVELYINNVKRFATSKTETVALEATKEIGRLFRTGVTRQTKHTEDITVRATIDITEKRRQSEELIKTLELTPDQFNRWTQTAKSESENLEK